ncbi:MAG: nitroreductase family protein [Firmicutes bacterium]|nr:nitroreductase family protein [Bacillota bacterium]
MNETLQTIHSRFSCRGFNQDKIISDKNLDEIINAGLASPSAYNSQSWHFIACKNKNILDKAQQYAIDYLNTLTDKSTLEFINKIGGKIFYNAPVVIFITRPKETGKLESINSGIAIQSMAIAATSLGIDSCMCGFTSMCFKDSKHNEELSKLLKFPKEYYCEVSLILGYGIQQNKAHEIDKNKYTIIE